MTRPQTFTPEQVVTAITEARGILAVAARRLGCSRQTLNTYSHRYASVRAALDDSRENLLDFTESKLLKLIDDENITAIIFYLKTQGKRRGYVERSEVTGAEGGHIVIRYADE